MSEGVNAYALLAKAANGEANASRELTSLAAGLAFEDGDLIALIESLTFGRLAYAQSGHPEDAGVLLGVLGTLVEACPDEAFAGYREQWSAEGIALASRLADQGQPIAEARLTELVESSSASATIQAKEIATLMAEAESEV